MTVVSDALRVSHMAVSGQCMAGGLIPLSSLLYMGIAAQCYLLHSRESGRESLNIAIVTRCLTI